MTKNGKSLFDLEIEYYKKYCQNEVEKIKKMNEEEATEYLCENFPRYLDKQGDLSSKEFAILIINSTRQTVLGE